MMYYTSRTMLFEKKECYIKYKIIRICLGMSKGNVIKI